MMLGYSGYICIIYHLIYFLRCSSWVNFWYRGKLLQSIRLCPFWERPPFCANGHAQLCSSVVSFIVIYWMHTILQLIAHPIGQGLCIQLLWCIFTQNSFELYSIPYPHHDDPCMTTFCHLHEFESSSSSWGKGTMQCIFHYKINMGGNLQLSWGGRVNSQWCRIACCKLLTFILLFQLSCLVIIMRGEGELTLL